mmetsp:Transcript_15163/g.14752  ORF Transcript_15163/g.14752 Transcript_15163/m.14752 type:complete len:159 (+) Transcript_15163:625-1101(+)
MQVEPFFMGMIPLIDMTNHKYESNIHYWYADDQHGLWFQADKDIRAGDEITITYRRMTYSESLLHYGFIEENVKIYSFETNFPLNRNDPLYKQKVKVLKDVFQQANFGRVELESEANHLFLRWVSMVVFDGKIEDFESFCRFIYHEITSLTLLIDLHT